MKTIRILIWIFFNTLGFLVGGLIGNQFGLAVSSAICGALVFAGISVASGITIVSEKNAFIIQCFGKHLKTLNESGQNAGLFFLCFRGIVDKVFKVLPVQQDFPIDLYRDDPEKATVVLKDTESRIKATSWIRITDPKKFAYEISDPASFIEGLLDSEVRPKLAVKTLNEANADKTQLIEDALTKINTEMKRCGAELVKLFIEDFELSADAKKIRDDLLKQETRAAGFEAQSTMWARSISVLAQSLLNEGLKDKEEAVKEAMKMFFEQTGMDAIKQSPATMTFIAESVKASLAIFAGKK